MTVSLDVNSRLVLTNSNGTFRERRSITPALASISGTKLNDLSTISTALDDIGISVGWGNGIHSNAGVPYSTLALGLENGIESRGIPARPYLAKSSQIVSRRLVDDIREVLQNLSLRPTRITAISMGNALQPVADKAADETRRIILTRAVNVPDNAPSTQRRKGSNLPWVDTRELIDALRGTVDINL